MPKRRSKSDDVSAMDQLMDEARVQAHLASAEARDSYDAFETRRAKLRQSALASWAIIKSTRVEVKEALGLATDAVRRSAVELRGLAIRGVVG